MLPHEAYHMVEMGLSVSVAAPLFIRYTRRWTQWRAISWPAIVAGPFFVLVHAAIVITMAETEPPLLLHALLHVAVFAGGVVFWLPVLGSRRRLGDGERCVYLYLLAPSLDLAAVWVVATGQSAAGLAMIVAMLPIGFIAVWLTWAWISREEAAVRAVEQGFAADLPISAR